MHLYQGLLQKGSNVTATAHCRLYLLHALPCSTETGTNDCHFIENNPKIIKISKPILIRSKTFQSLVNENNIIEDDIKLTQ